MNVTIKICYWTKVNLELPLLVLHIPSKKNKQCDIATLTLVVTIFESILVIKIDFCDKK